MIPTTPEAQVKNTKRTDILYALQRAVDQLHTATSNVLSAEGEPEGIGEGVWVSIGSGDKTNYIYVSTDGSVTVLPSLSAPFSLGGSGYTLVSLSSSPPPGLPSPFVCPTCQDARV